MDEMAFFAPRAEENPWKTDDFKTATEWREIALWYPFSLRLLLPDGRWYEQARCSSREDACQVIKVLSAAKISHLNSWIVVQCFRYGKAGREKVVLFSPSKARVLASLADALKAKR